MIFVFVKLFYYYYFYYFKFSLFCVENNVSSEKIHFISIKKIWMKKVLPKPGFKLQTRDPQCNGRKCFVFLSADCLTDWASRARYKFNVFDTFCLIVLLHLWRSRFLDWKYRKHWLFMRYIIRQLSYFIYRYLYTYVSFLSIKSKNFFFSTF